LACVAFGRWVDHESLNEQRAQQSWHLTSAVLLKPAVAQPRYYYLRARWGTDVPALARWNAPGGRLQIGEVPAPTGSAAGSTVQVWVDASGRPTGPPLLRADLLKRVIGAVTLALLGVAVVLFGLGRLVRWLMDRRRLAGWEANWASIGPRWTRHR
jgi:hypothetical protein